MSRSKRECEDCERTGKHRGWNYNFDDPTRRVYRYWCDAHYLFHMFGLLPFTCTEDCRKKHSREVDLSLRPKDMVVWLGLGAALTAETPLTEESPCSPCKSADPKCPWCGEKMRPAEGVLGV